MAGALFGMMAWLLLSPAAIAVAAPKEATRESLSDSRCVDCREAGSEEESSGETGVDGEGSDEAIPDEDSPGEASPAAPLVDRANSLQQAGQRAEAIGLYREALALDPYYLPARVNLVTLYSRAGDDDASRQLLETGLELPDTRPADRGHLAYLLALSLAEQGEFEPALDWLNRDAEWRPGHVRTYYNQALLLDRLGQKEKALDALHKGLYLAPESPDLLYAAVYLNATQGNVNRALAVMEKLRRIAPDDPQLGRLEQQLKGQMPQ
ncbi:tetratricopeptide repeat protein [Salinicola halimionae]|uniref:tetratricopeptide repeat protein n=1 Tax=Salinicola halimionae TaxID=1949081 RepID=UPI00165FF9C8|nr:tetratricopeptide repeat protein [Salinicola halimionae]